VLDWSPGSIKGTVGAGGLGILMLSIPSLDALHVPFWVAFAVALLPALVFIVASPDLVPPRAVRAAHAAAAGWYGLFALASLGVALARGFSRFDLVFLGFVLLGAWPCAVALRRRRDALDPASVTAARAQALARQRDAAARAARGVPLEFKASRRKALGLFAGSIAFVALGLWARHANPWLGWTCVLFFGLGIPASVAMLLPNSTFLRLDARGFEMSSFFRRHQVAWQDVGGFGLASVGGRRMIAIAYAPSYRGQRALRRAAASVAGIEGAIPDHYDAPIDAVLDALLAWKAAAPTSSRTHSPSR
jgi:hypothetical protein